MTLDLREEPITVARARPTRLDRSGAITAPRPPHLGVRVTAKDTDTGLEASAVAEQFGAGAAAWHLAPVGAMTSRDAAIRAARADAVYSLNRALTERRRREEEREAAREAASVVGGYSEENAHYADAAWHASERRKLLVNNPHLRPTERDQRDADLLRRRGLLDADGEFEPDPEEDAILAAAGLLGETQPAGRVKEVATI